MDLKYAPAPGIIRIGRVKKLRVQRSELGSTLPLFFSLASIMAACLGSELAEAVKKSRVFVVGTGGIGCELVKNLVLTGFQDIVMVRTRVRARAWQQHSFSPCY